MFRLQTCLLLLALSSCACSVTACAPDVSTSTNGTYVDWEMADQLVKGETTEAQANKIIRSRDRVIELQADGRSLWIYAWTRVTADENHNILRMEIRDLKVWLKDGVVDEVEYSESGW